MKFSPSPYQEAILKRFQETNDSISVNAVAGGAKTTTLYMLANALPKTKQYSAIALCFNITIRDAMAAKLPSEIESANFHRVGKRILQDHLNKKFFGKTGVNQYKYPNIIEDLLGGKRVADQEQRASASEALNFCQLTLTDPEDEEAFEELCFDYGIRLFDNTRALVIRALQIGTERAADGIDIDFNDMLWLPLVLEARFPKYMTIFLDECQDLNACQREFVLRMKDKKGRIIAVGDPHQAIYGFAGADTDSFKKVQEAIQAVEMPLSLCYRCPKSHIKLAQEIVPHILPTNNAKEGAIRQVTYRDGLELMSPQSGDLVLSRTTAPLITAMFDLLKLRIPAKISGRKGSHRPLITLARSLTESDTTLVSLPDKLAYYQEREENRIKVKFPDDFRKLEVFVDKCESLQAMLEAAIEDGCRSIEEFESWMRGFFDEEIHGAVILSSVHRAKGLEAKNVFIIDEQKMPHPMAKTSEQRVQEMNIRYVALTRAQETLTFVDPKPQLRGVL